MFYQYKCKSCEQEQKVNVSIEERDTAIIKCERCNADMMRVFNNEEVFVSLKGWGWTGRDYKEKRNRESHSVDMALKQFEHHGTGERLVPNYKGKEADSWQEVRHQVRSEKGEAEARQFDHLVRKEQESKQTTRAAVVEKTVQSMRG